MRANIARRRDAELGQQFAPFARTGFGYAAAQAFAELVMRLSIGSGAIAGALAIAAACLVAPAARAADFYAGKTINFIVGGDAAGGYDVYARTIAKHLARFIPGHPTIVVQNMPGAGSAKAAAYLFRIAPKDGTTIGALFPGPIIDPLLQKRAVGQYDATKFTYLATADSDARICATGPASKITTFNQAMTAKTVIGASQSGGSTSDYAFMIKNSTGVKFNVVNGYAGSATILVAIERGEADGICGLDWSSFKTERPQWVQDKTAHVLIQTATKPNAELAALNVPHVEDFVKNDRDKQAVSLVISQQAFSRPYVAPPGVPAQQSKILRDAFAAVLHDPQFRADAEKARLSINPSSGDEVQQAVTKLYSASGEVVQRARQLIASPAEQK
jgi:tripartite-type tricarboxylate transporter receptor subunit TctC